MFSMRTVFVALVALALTDCGFHLRGSPEDTAMMKMPFKSVYVAPGSQIYPSIVRQLAFRPDVVRVNDIKAAEAVLRVAGEHQEKETSALTRAGQVAEYRLIYSVTVTLERNKVMYGEPVTVRVHRTFPYSDNSVLGKAEEEQTVWKSLRDDAATLLLYRIAALKPVDPLAPVATPPAKR